MADAKLLNLAKILGRLNKVPDAARVAVKDQLKTEADDLVAAIQRAMDAVYATSDPDHQRLRDSVHDYPDPNRIMGVVIIADARDANGEFTGSHVEAGHRTVNGAHVAARPAFFPTYRARKKKMKARIRKAGADAIREAYEG